MIWGNDSHTSESLNEDARPLVHRREVDPLIQGSRLLVRERFDEVPVDLHDPEPDGVLAGRLAALPERYKSRRLTHEGRGGQIWAYLPTFFWKISENFTNFRKFPMILLNSHKFREIPTKIRKIQSEKLRISLSKLRNSKISWKIREKKVDENLLKFWIWSGAKVCKSCRSRKMLKNEYLDAKIGLDTEENEPSKVCRYQPTTPPTVICTALLAPAHAPAREAAGGARA